MMDYPQLKVWPIITTEEHRAAFAYQHVMEFNRAAIGMVDGQLALRTLDGREMYTLDNPAFGQVVIDVTSIKRKLARKLVPFEMLRADLDQRWVDYTYDTGGCEEAGIERLTADDCKRPGIMIDWGQGHTTMVDGNHRLVRTWRNGGTTFEIAWVRFPVIKAHVVRPGDEEKLFHAGKELL